MIFRRSGVLENGRMKKYRSANDAGLTDQNYWGNGSDGSVTISSDTTWDSTSSGDMMVKNLVDFTVNSGVTLTITARKGCLIYVSGNCVINGTISMLSGYACDPSEAGVPSGGLVIVRKKTGSTESGSSDLTGCGSTAINAEANQSAISGNGKKYTIPRTGASGGASKTSGAGNPGTAGSGIQTGGGGGGGAWSAASGAGAAGTCFSGGGGGAGSYKVTSGSATAYGGRGGDQAGGAAGGAGNPGGSGSTNGQAGSSGIGGTLLLFVKGNLTIASGAYIKSNGTAGGNMADNAVGCGGGSGGGIIIALYGGTLSNSGTVQASGGAGGVGDGYTNPNTGGAGGAGTTTIEQIMK